MWWRRWVSPVVGSTAIPGVTSALCERCMPRLDGDFLFCWTAMAGSWDFVGAAPQGGRRWMDWREREKAMGQLREAHDYSPSRVSARLAGLELLQESEGILALR